MAKYTHLIDGVKVDYTAEEDTARDAEIQAWNDDQLNRDLNELRKKRNILLSQTDFYALSDVTLADNMKTYRENLRNLPSGLDTVSKVTNVTWPTKP